MSARGESARRLSGVQQRALLGVAVVALVAILLVAILSGGDDSPNSGREISLPEIGLALEAPKDWSRDISKTAVELRSPDRTIVLSLSSPVAGREPSQVKSALKDQLREQLAPAKVIEDGKGRLGKRRVASFELTGRLSGRPVRAVGLIEDTQFRTYAVTLFTGQPGAAALQEVRAILRSVELSEPKGGRGEPGGAGADQ